MKNLLSLLFLCVLILIYNNKTYLYDKSYLYKNKDSIIYDFDKKLHEYKSKLNEDFIFLTYSCFLIISNLQISDLNKIVDNSISIPQRSFYNNYFINRPDEIITIFLFKDTDSYKYWAKSIFEDENISSFGYFKPTEKVALINISTGEGTLVHELTHIFISYDFPEIPVWLDEGLGSLYEHCVVSNFEIKGLINWRLPTLQKVIKDKHYKPLKDLFSISKNEFYGNHSDFYYAQARYFCFYMQEKGVLKQFYREFRDNFTIDSTGNFFIEKVFGNKIDYIDFDFIQWVMNLKYN
ncbi:MAG: hypothetical protein N2490_06490 [Ignavibacteria bacterium]|nr:hypothetical protein [Ignavibacteria bacterium]